MIECCRRTLLENVIAWNMVEALRCNSPGMARVGERHFRNIRFCEKQLMELSNGSN